MKSVRQYVENEQVDKKSLFTFKYNVLLQIKLFFSNTFLHVKIKITTHIQFLYVLK